MSPFEFYKNYGMPPFWILLRLSDLYHLHLQTLRVLGIKFYLRIVASLGSTFDLFFLPSFCPKK